MKKINLRGKNGLCSNIAFLRLGDVVQPPEEKHLKRHFLYQLVYQEDLKANRDFDSEVLSSRGLAFVAIELCTKLHYTILTKMKKLNYVTLCYKKIWSHSHSRLDHECAIPREMIY